MEMAFQHPLTDGELLARSDGLLDLSGSDRLSLAYQGLVARFTQLK
jgi:hypothetical protein